MVRSSEVLWILAYRTAVLNLVIESACSKGLVPKMQLLSAVQWKRGSAFVYCLQSFDKPSRRLPWRGSIQAAFW